MEREKLFRELKDLEMMVRDYSFYLRKAMRIGLLLYGAEPEEIEQLEKEYDEYRAAHPSIF